MLWTGKGKPESERKSDLIEITLCEYGMDMFDGEQINLLELRISSVYSQGEFQYPFTLTGFLLFLNMLENLLIRMKMQVVR